MRSDRRPVTPGFAIDHQTPPGAVVPSAPRDARRRRPIDVVARRVPPIRDLPVARRRRVREERDGTQFATGVRNTWVAFWWNAWSVGRWCVIAAVAVFFVARVWFGQPWGWVAAALPIVVLVLWLGVVLRQGVRHTRGQAGPPPGWIGRL